MNLQSIIITNCIGCTMLIILLISSHLVRQRRQLSDNLFTAMILMVGSSCLMEMLTFIIDGKFFPGVRIIHMLGDTYLYIVNLLFVFSWCLYVDLRLRNDEKRIKELYLKKRSVPAVICCISALLNLKFEFLFYLDEDNIYHRRVWSYIYSFLTFAYLIYSVVIRDQYYRQHGKSRFFPIYMFLVPIFLGTVAQFIFYGISVAWCCAALGLTGIYMSLQNELSYIDPLTKLYNRNYLDHTIHEITRRNLSAGGIMIDLDDFKTINDTYGHSVGDEALIDAAELIRCSVPSNAVPVRFAGDEFIIILKTRDEVEIMAVIDTLRNALREFNQTSERPYQLSFSMGFSIYQPESTADKFLNEMDENMYDEKRTKHSRSSEKKPTPA